VRSGIITLDKKLAVRGGATLLWNISSVRGVATLYFDQISEAKRGRLFQWAKKAIESYDNIIA
jgi:hypothetical protein